MAARGKAAKRKTAAKASRRKSKVKSSDKTPLETRSPKASKGAPLADKKSVKLAKGTKTTSGKIAKPAKGAKTKSAKATPSVKAKPSKPIQLFFWPTPNGFKISIALEEMKLPYEVKAVDITKGEQFAPEFLKISPNNRMPAIIDPDGPGGKPISVFESGAILQYLAHKTGKLYPENWRKRVAVDEWLFWQVGGLGPMAGQAHHFLRAAPEKIPYAIERYVDEARRLYGVMDKRLAGRPFLAGAYSIADIAASCWARYHDLHHVGLDVFPNVKRWLDVIDARPAVKRGLAIGAELRAPPPPSPQTAD